MLLREEWRRSRQGKKVSDGRCGRTIEAKPLSGQTCLIEPANGAPQGKKVSDGRCGRTIEAKPLSGQTCLIEPANGAPLTSGKGT
ncbi:hypothetical protein ASG42_30995 [Rhizobium sp. Leaf391]|nr:hypothetical protein ASG42_30995 [Rhizobium sp. Leaf391]